MYDKLLHKFQAETVFRFEQKPAHLCANNHRTQPKFQNQVHARARGRLRGVRVQAYAEKTLPKHVSIVTALLRRN